MIISHQHILAPAELNVLFSGINVARASLDRFDGPRHQSHRWSGSGRLISDALTRTALKSKGRILNVEYIASRETFRIEIREADRDLRAPIITVQEQVPTDRHPAAASPEEIDATLVRWTNFIAAAIPSDLARYSKWCSLAGALALSQGGDEEVLGNLSVLLPSIYGPSIHRASSDRISQYGEEPFSAVAAILNGEFGERIMASEATSTITSRWWNYATQKRQSRVLFDLSAGMAIKLNYPDPLETLRLLAA